MITIRQLMTATQEKSAVSVSQDASVFEALKLMAENNIGALLVLDDKGQMVGIFSERDYARKIILLGKSSLNTPVKEIMSVDMITITPEQTLEEGLELMTQHHIRHLPITESGHLIGMISMRDLVAALLNQKDMLIGRLEGYIMGSDYNR
jgi:CBS domain-containing protein